MKNINKVTNIGIFATLTVSAVSHAWIGDYTHATILSAIGYVIVQNACNSSKGDSQND